MNTHPYLRAYMAGVCLPSVFLLLALTAFIVSRLVFAVPVPIERVLVFPMALVPNLFGLWNMFYLWLRPRPHLPIGFHGALLPLILFPIGAGLACWLGFLRAGENGVTLFAMVTASYRLIALWFLAAMTVYYLIWKYVVGFLNQVLGIA